VNVPVVDMTPDSGSTEIWPGTHLDTTRSLDEGDIKIAPEDEARRRSEVEPLQPHVPAGGVVIRDMRLWHRGMPNHTDTARPMIAMVHYVRWWHIRKTLILPKGTEELFAGNPLNTIATFVDEPIDYISRNKKYDYK
jgi:ectoine hydroxylase-related dioxygenase (phytanoyl-CoA dioxygenase family)